MDPEFKPGLPEEQTEPKNPKHLKVRLFKKHISFSNSRAIAFAITFAAIGSYFIFSSFAAGPQQSDASFAPGEVLVKFKADTPQATQDDLLGKQKAHVKQEIPHIGVKVITVPENAEAAVSEALSHNPAVEFAEKNWIAKPQEQLPNDPYFPDRAYAIAGGAWGWRQTHTTEAWDITKGDPSVIIAILDTGLRPQGLEFDGQLVSGWNVTNNTSDYTTNSGVHGTYVAGVAGLPVNNGVGNAGYCPGCKIMPVQVGTDSGATYANMASGITWATDHGARIQNLSFGGTSSSSTLASAVTYARSKNVVIFAAAGNSNCDCQTYPSATPGVLGVGGVGDAGSKAGDSNYGSWVAIAAPEGNLTSWPAINGSQGYAPVGGTSVASPAAAAMAGLVLSAKPDLTGVQLEQTIESTTIPASFTVKYGEVNPLAAMASLGLADPQPSSAPVQTAAAQIYYAPGSTCTEFCVIPLTSAPSIGQLLVRGFGGWTGSAGLTITGLQWQRCSNTGSNCTSVGTASKYTVQSADAGSTIRLVFSVKNTIGSTAQSVLTAPVGGGSSSVDTTLPSVSLTSPADAATVSGSVPVSATATDNVGVTKVEFYADNILFSTVTTSPYNTTWNASGLATGSSHTLTAKAYDAAGNVGTSATVTVLIASPADSTPPSVSITTPANNSTLIGTSTTISAKATDNVAVASMKLYIDGSLKASSTVDILNYKWNTRKTTKGTHIILVQAFDAIGNTGTSSLTVSK